MQTLVDEWNALPAHLDIATKPYLSIVIPAYNEAGRLPDTIAAVFDHTKLLPYGVELLVVDDGSKDDTAQIGALLIPEGKGRVLREPHRGKAAAVLAGMLAAEGDYVIFMDADLAVPVADVHRLLQYLEYQGYGVAIGSREGTGASRVGEPLLRHVMGRVYNLIVQIVAVPGIQDTQCGFKMFRADVARDIFPRMKLYTLDSPVVTGARVTGFDVEVLFLARRRGYLIKEVPVRWKYGAESKVSPLRDTWYNFRDVIRVRWNDMRGRYM